MFGISEAIASLPLPDPFIGDPIDSPAIESSSTFRAGLFSKDRFVIDNQRKERSNRQQ